MADLYDLLLAEYMQVWLHQVHMADAWASDGEAQVLALVQRALARVGQLSASTHTNAPALHAALHALLLRAAQAPMPAITLKQELAKVLYTALRRSTGANGGPAAATQAFALSFPPEFAPLPSAADFINWT
ncbi:hypothetical protein [Hymenobacter coccineus]|uniref:Uncharacterized protein n=1 Tax=Hymenobacter coccineus TaxID=1908235 RepID=A0A1G1TKN8_9BACT|nr:hypothetical protein [Hymenobacter coccineus]OGX91420.1 hypothetical protein BEN49_19880 [Hymenobacter coccineus]